MIDPQEDVIIGAEDPAFEFAPDSLPDGVIPTYDDGSPAQYSVGCLYPGMPCWSPDDLPEDLGFDPVDPSSFIVDPAADTIIGSPEIDAQYWMYQGDGNGTCAPTSVAMMLSDVLDVPLSNDAIIERAIELGVITYDPSQEGLDAWSGMNDSGIMILAESFGLDVSLHYGDVDDLANYLAAGHAVTVGIDADEIWYGEDDDAADGGVGGNHQVVVTGIDLTNGVVYLNDSGDPDGQGSVIPLDQFVDAWGDCANSMIVTNLPSDEAAAGVDVDAALGNAAPGAPISGHIVPGDAIYFIDPALVPAADQPEVADGEEAIERSRIDAPVPAWEGPAQLLILPFTFIVKLADAVL